MPRICTACSHPQRSEIDRALVDGTANRAIARQFALSKDAVARHKAEHLPAKLARAENAKEIGQADNLLLEVRSLQARALSILDAAERGGDPTTALKAISEARRTLELLAKLTGELNENPTVNIHLAPTWIHLRTTILRTLEPYPDARVALASVLVEGTGDA